MSVSDQKLVSHLSQIEKENVLFLMSSDGGGLSVEQVALRLGVGRPGLEKKIHSWERRG